ncbi:MAG: hypothetical protein ACM3KD_07395 [Hyphomicrobiaceae bacterium]
MRFPTYYSPSAEGLAFKNGAPWRVHGWLSKDDGFVAVDGRSYPADMAMPINPFDGSLRGERESQRWIPRPGARRPLLAGNYRSE